ncbi:MAG: tripartite tricarboxylate transporter TctB family protein [Comamonadaceae bacterium]|nr:tripartite tricarboxylate transporter TctB family protein [Comamonadaceae bacterium]
MVGLGGWLIVHPALGTTLRPRAPESRWGRLWIALGTMAFYVAALERLGFPLATALLLFVQLRWVEGRRWQPSAWIAVLARRSSRSSCSASSSRFPCPPVLVPLPRGW